MDFTPLTSDILYPIMKRRYADSRSKSASSSQVAKVAKYMRNNSFKRYMSVPRNRISTETIYRFRRSANFLCGVNTVNGFTDISGGVIIGQGLAIGCSMNSIYFRGTVNNSTVSIPNVSEFSALFDRYRIKSFTVKIIPTININSAQSFPIGTAPSACLPILQAARDYDDVSPPTTTNDLLQRSDFRSWRLEKAFKSSVMPYFTMSGQQDPVVGGTAPSVLGRGQFLDTSSDGQNTLWCGLKLFMETLTTAPGVQLGLLMFYVDVEYEFKTPR